VVDLVRVIAVVRRVLLAGLLATVAWLPFTGVASAATHVAGGTDRLVAQVDARPHAADSVAEWGGYRAQETPAPPPDGGEPAQQPESKNRVIVGAIAAVLLAVVILGRRERTRRRKKAG